MLNFRILGKVLTLAAALFAFQLGPPSFTTATAGELTPLYPGYPEVFDMTGTVTAKEKDLILIEDSQFQLAPGATYHGPRGPVGAAGISVGDQVGVLLTEEKEAKSVWLIKAGSKDDKDKAPEPSGTKSQMKKENGVWRN